MNGTSQIKKDDENIITKCIYYLFIFFVVFIVIDITKIYYLNRASQLNKEGVNIITECIYYLFIFYNIYYYKTISIIN